MIMICKNASKMKKQFTWQKNTIANRKRREIRFEDNICTHFQLQCQLLGLNQLKIYASIIQNLSSYMIQMDLNSEQIKCKTISEKALRESYERLSVQIESGTGDAGVPSDVGPNVVGKDWTLIPLLLRRYTSHLNSRGNSQSGVVFTTNTALGIKTIHFDSFKCLSRKNRIKFSIKFTAKKSLQPVINLGFKVRFGNQVFWTVLDNVVKRNTLDLVFI